MAKRGGKCKLYINTGTYASPTWAEVGIARDVTTNLGKGENDASVRIVDWELITGGLKTLELSFDIRYEPADSVYQDLRDAYWDDTVLDVAVMGGPIATTGSEGIRFPGLVTAFTKGEPLNDTATNSVTIKPTIDPLDEENVPTKHVISA